MGYLFISSAKRKLGFGIELRSRNPNITSRDMGTKKQPGLEEAHYSFFFPLEHTQQLWAGPED
jgi:hypothetical protein